MPEISVIVPVYRAEAYLEACIDSILSQSFSDFELILADDGSPDGSGAICERYARKDSRITVFHQENQGQAAARNHGLEKAKAPWICFVDSDDLIHPRTLEWLHEAAVRTGASISMCQMLEAPELPESFRNSREAAPDVKIMDDAALARMYDEGTYPAWVACGKLIRRERIEAYPFQPGRVYEDNEAVCRWVAGERLAILPQKLYYYRTNPDSTTQKSFSLKRLDFLWALESIVTFYGEIGFPQTKQRFLDRFLRETAGFYRVVKPMDGAAARGMKRSVRRLLKAEGATPDKSQFEELLDAMHPKLIRLYWPVEGIVRTLGREGISGVFRKLSKHLGGKRS